MAFADYIHKHRMKDIRDLANELQKYLLLDGSRKMTGKLLALDAEFDVGHDSKLEITPVEWTPGNWFPSVRGTGSWGQYALWEGGLILYKNVDEKVAINLYEYTRTNYAYIAWKTFLEFYTSLGGCKFDIDGDINLTSRNGVVNIPKAGDITLQTGEYLGLGGFSSLPTATRSKLIVKSGVPFPAPGTPDELYWGRTHGFSTAWAFVNTDKETLVPYESIAGPAWSDPTDSPLNGSLRLRYNSGAGETRLYGRSNGAWVSVQLS